MKFTVIQSALLDAVAVVMKGVVYNGLLKEISGYSWENASSPQRPPGYYYC